MAWATLANDVTITRQGMEYQHGVVACGVEGPPRFIGHRDRRGAAAKGATCFESKRLLIKNVDERAFPDRVARLPRPRRRWQAIAVGGEKVAHK
jgi:hypothetical protein